MKKALQISIFLLTFAAQAQTEFKFRVWLKDKSGTTLSLAKPEEYLTKRAIDRRLKEKISIDSTDLPVSEKYQSALSNMGLRIVTKSRWMNTIVVATKDTSITSQLRKLAFVKGVEWVWQGQPASISAKLRSETDASETSTSNLQEEYGNGLTQLSVSNGQKLHQAGFRGEGMVIALIDAGFKNADTISAYKKTVIHGTKDFVNPGGNVYNEDKHGESVLSTIAAVDSFHFIGSAPKASFWLFRSEDAYSEYPIEEDYWAAAAEYADSVGVDLINSSLGYAQFDNPILDHTHEQLDGKTIFVTKAAQMATNKGIFVSISAGNEGNKPWGKINAPADAVDVLTVGAINAQQQIAAFSSLGYTADNRVKPDVVAVGSGTYLLDSNGKATTGSGTSFSSPLMTGMVACLWQALPNLTNKELLHLIRTQSNFYNQPDTRYGYGIPDLWAAYQLKTSNPLVEKDKPEIFFNNKKGNSITIRNLPAVDSTYTIYIYNGVGKMVFTETIDSKEFTCNVRSLKRGFYIVYIEGKTQRFTKKLMK